MTAVFMLALLFGLLGLILGNASRRIRQKDNPLADAIDALLPQTQCGQCGYPGCRPYAEAIAKDEADINQCPPGGDACIKALAELLNLARKPLDVRRGEAKPTSVALIDERRCIGCALCLQACPVDAILGAPRFMHTVLTSECTGCELCLPPCPVDCIAIVPAQSATAKANS